MKAYFLGICILTVSLPAVANAAHILIEPGVFFNFNSGSDASFDDGTKEYDGVMRNADPSWALKVGIHHDKFEYGVEGEIYHLTAHLEDSDGDFTKDATVTYNSIFFGFEFYPRNILYFSVSDTPFAQSDGDSFIEKKNTFSLEYSYHLKKWASINAKIETAASLENEGKPDKKFKYRDLFFVGISFPITRYEE